MASSDNQEGDAVPSQQPPLASPSDTPELPPAALELAHKLFDMARSGDTESLIAYIKAGVPPNLTNQTGDTLLMLAAYHGHADTTRALLEVGADPNRLNDRGQSILAGSVFKGWDDVVKVLVNGGADIWAGAPNAVDSARMFGKEDYLKLFGLDKDKVGSSKPWEDGNRGETGDGAER
jgi:ankyrin repeat protein